MKTPRYKYPRTPHLPWSPGASPDDVSLSDVSRFEGVEVVVTEKMDGENTSIYSDGTHARSLDSRHHPSRAWVKQLQARIGHQLPEGWRVCGENLYARHSIAYDALPSWFMVFSIWTDENACLNWNETLEWASLLGLEVVPALYRGPWSEATVKALRRPRETSEGYVVRTTSGFSHEAFAEHVAKFVRANHVETDTHWMHAPVVVNGVLSG